MFEIVSAQKRKYRSGCRAPDTVLRNYPTDYLNIYDSKTRRTSLNISGDNMQTEVAVSIMK